LSNKLFPFKLMSKAVFPSLTVPPKPKFTKVYPLEAVSKPLTLSWLKVEETFKEAKPSLNQSLMLNSVLSVLFQLLAGINGR
jgi:hypothetical protein